MKIFRIAFFYLLPAFCVFAQGHVVTFDQPPVQPWRKCYAISQYAEAGLFLKPFGPIDTVPPFRMALNGGGLDLCPHNGTAYLQILDGDSLEFFRTNGEIFSLVSVDLAEYSTVTAQFPTITFNGIKSDGSTVSESFTLDGIRDGTGPLADFQTFTFGPEFTDLVHVSVPDQIYSLDNLVFQVPEPAIGWLVILGGSLFLIRQGAIRR